MKKPIIVFLIIGPLLFPLFCRAQAYLEEEMACQSLEQGRVEEAIALLAGKIQRYPRNYDCHLYLGVAYYLKKDWAKAMQILNRVEFEVEKVDQAKNTLEAGKRLPEFGQEDAFLAQSAGVVFTKEKKGLLKFTLGLLYKRKGDFKEAGKRLEDVFGSPYPEAEARRQLAVVYAGLREYRKSSEELDRLRAIVGDDESSDFLDGYVSYYLKDESRALEKFRESQGKILESRKNLAIIYYNQGNFQSSLEIWNAVLAENPLDAEALKNTGRCYYQMGDKERAQQQFDKLGLKIKPEKYSPKTILLVFTDVFPEAKIDLQCRAK